MLPDYPKLKKVIQKHIDYILQDKINEFSPIAQDIKHHTIHEGRNPTLIKSDKSEEIELKEHSEGIYITPEEVVKMNYGELMNKIEIIAKGFANAKEKMIIEELNKATETTGNVVKSEKKPISAELILEALEKMEISFNKDGHHDGLTFIIPPEMNSQVDNEMSRIQKESDLLEKYNKIMEKKLKDHYAREASRKLVG